MPFTREQVQRYIQFARTLNPVIPPESRPELVQCYRMLRSNDLLGERCAVCTAVLCCVGFVFVFFVVCTLQTHDEEILLCL